MISKQQEQKSRRFQVVRVAKTERVHEACFMLDLHFYAFGLASQVTS